MFFTKTRKLHQIELERRPVRLDFGLSHITVRSAITIVEQQNVPQGTSLPFPDPLKAPERDVLVEAPRAFKSAAM